DRKSILFEKYPFESRRIYAFAYLQLYNLHHSQFPYDVSIESTNWLLIAKYILFSIYKDHVENITQLDDKKLCDCLELLSSCFCHLSRWFEALHCISLLEKKKISTNNGSYLEAITLDVLWQKTCMSFNYQLFLKIIDCCLDVRKSKRAIPEQKQQTKRIEDHYRKELRKHKILVLKLRKQYARIRKSPPPKSQYIQFVISRNLYLNEHGYFCLCGKSRSDSLKVETDHPHSKSKMGKENEAVVTQLKNQFILARKLYFESIYQDRLKRKSKLNLENAHHEHLKQSFKICYSILDVIANGIFRTMNIVPSKKGKIYFHTICDGITEEHFRENYYLISLYSIAKDIDQTEYSAFKTYREIRNAFEHKIVHFTEKPILECVQNEMEQFYQFDEMVQKTELLLTLTKSAIFSFTYFIRRQTKAMEVLNQMK
ncbi:MAG TPA: LA2681 family HEPN domain-containing protein, partial [Bacteroidia bacterium]|nr:LA2681 family HEPN domain-containing protein [Bacteroidia bacterium]